MAKQEEIRKLIKELKDFYKISNFSTEIIFWKFDSDKIEKLLNKNQKIVIGHPINSHKGQSLGDILPYTRLPEEIYNKYNIKCYVPKHFWNVFKYNPYVAGIDNNIIQWGSLGPFGTTVQRTCNVWGIKTKYFSPSLYHRPNKPIKNRIAISVNSNTGGQIQDIKKINNIIQNLKPDYELLQIGTNIDPILPGMDRYCFNLKFDQLVDCLSTANYYIGVQNSLYHLSKALGLKLIGILPENVDPFFVKLPFLTQCNDLETNMLPLNEKIRMNNWMSFVIENNRDPNLSHHIGWLYPDTTHLTMRNKEESTKFCPEFTLSNLLLALKNKLYPYNESKLYDYYSNVDYWV